MLAYLFSRFPVVSQTFCDTEMLALEAAGHELVIGSLNPPPTSFRHERLARLKAEILYPPPSFVLDRPLQQPPQDDPVWRAMSDLAEEHNRKYGAEFKAGIRARNAWYFARVFKAHGVRHVHVHFANRATHTALFLKKAGLPFSFTAHAQDFMVDLGNDDLLREMIREASFTVAVSDFSRELLAKICPDAESRIHRIYNGIDSDQFPAATPGSLQEPLTLVSIGRLIDFKGFPVLLDALAILRGNGIPAMLQIIGDGPLRPALEAQSVRLQLQDSVRFRGILTQEEIKHELASAHIFALACMTDSKGATDILPTVILEAMACGLPVVSTTLAGVPEMVLHDQTGLLAPPGDAAALAAHLTRLAMDSELRESFGKAGLRHVSEGFSLQNTAGQLGAMFPDSAVAQQSDNITLKMAAPSGAVLCLVDMGGFDADPALLRELAYLSGKTAVSLMATRQSTLGKDVVDEIADRFEYFPDAVVLEAAWRASPALVAQCESLRGKAGPVDGESFYIAARRAVYLASQAAQRGWREIHAMRANMVPTAWLLHQLIDLPVSATVEADHQESRSVLNRLLADFVRGSNSDVKLKSHLPDLLKLLPPAPARRVLGVKLRPVEAPPFDPAPVWEAWLVPHLSLPQNSLLS